MEMYQVSVFGVLVMIAYCLGTVTGFGSAILVLPAAALFFGAKTGVPVVVALSSIPCVYVVLRAWKDIKWREFGFIMLHAVIGLPLGICLFDVLSGGMLKLGLACFTVVVGIRGFAISLRRKQNDDDDGAVASRKSLLMRAWVVMGGIIHGAVGAGGPLIVIYASRVLTDKKLFRVTLCLLWLCLNSIMMLKWTVVGGVWNRSVGTYILVGLPFLVIGTALGDLIHNKLDELIFKRVVYLALIVSGLTMGYQVYRSFGGEQAQAVLQVMPVDHHVV